MSDPDGSGDPDTPEDPDDGDDRSDPDDRPAFLQRLIDLLEELDEMDLGETARRSGTIDRDDVRVDVDYDVRVGLGEDHAPRAAPGDDRSRDDDDRVDTGPRERVIDARDGAGDPADDTGTPDEPLFDVRRYDDETVVTVDLPGVDAERVTVDYEPGEGDDAATAGADDVEEPDSGGALVVRVDGDPVRRLPVDAGRVTDVSFNNGLLVVRLAGGE